MRAWHYIAGTLLLALVIAAFVVWRFFQLGSESETLRASFMGATQGKWDKKIALHIGMFSTTLVRAGSRFFTMPAEPRAALEAVRSVEFGVYELREEAVRIEAGAILPNMDKAMAACGWDRVVGVIHEHQLVAVYVPRRGVHLSSLSCCLLVLEDRNLVVLSAKGNPEPLITLARSKLELKWKRSAGSVPLSANVASIRQ